MPRLGTATSVTHDAETKTARHVRYRSSSTQAIRTHATAGSPVHSTRVHSACGGSANARYATLGHNHDCSCVSGFLAAGRR